mmetsp:Transcript_93959/g.242803  ORF Transcript_93959/g.242803 Transcript_93959/m.242803 type:complete len:274 (+) Transcript_93959:247-1068(+)
MLTPSPAVAPSWTWNSTAPSGARSSTSATQAGLMAATPLVMTAAAGGASAGRVALLAEASPAAGAGTSAGAGLAAAAGADAVLGAEAWNVLGRLSTVPPAGLGSAASSSAVSGLSRLPFGAAAAFALASAVVFCGPSFTRSPYHFSFLSRLKSVTSSRLLPGRPFNRGTVSSGMISFDKGWRRSVKCQTSPSSRRRRSSTCTVSGSQFTLNCRTVSTRLDAPSPMPRWSFRSSVTSTVDPSSVQRYVFNRTSFAGVSDHSLSYSLLVAGCCAG